MALRLGPRLWHRSDLLARCSEGLDLVFVCVCMRERERERERETEREEREREKREREKSGREGGRESLQLLLG